jgi:outer membrane protein insertion porin family/translocation and assembly module TamA
VGWRVTRNHADDALNPTRGSLASLELRHASTYVGSQSDLQFNKAVGDASWYVPVGGGNTFAVRLRFGGVVGIGSSAGVSQFIPPQERLYAGGASSVRGYRQNELGPAVYVITPTVSAKAYDTVTVLGVTTFQASGALRQNTVRIVPTGGNTIAVGNVELRLKSPVLPQFVQFTLFTDAGAVWNRGRDAETLDLSAIKVTPGVGVRVFSLIGPVRMDVGYNPYVRPSGALYFDASRVTTEGAKVAPLYCVSPGNKLPVTLNPTGLATQASGSCDASYVYSTPTSFWRRLTFHFSIGQAF